MYGHREKTAIYGPRKAASEGINILIPNFQL